MPSTIKTKYKQTFRIMEWCKIENGWCLGCGKAEAPAKEVCFYNDPFWSQRRGYTHSEAYLNFLGQKLHRKGNYFRPKEDVSNFLPLPKKHRSATIVNPPIVKGDFSSFIEKESPELKKKVKRNTIAKSRRETIFERDGYKCLACGYSEKLTIDHIHPLIKGGSNENHNLQTLCDLCNQAKGEGIRDFRNKELFKNETL